MSLVLNNLTKTYGAQAVVDHVSLSIDAKGLTGIIGPNGAGKSTLFSLITGFIGADGGTLSYAGTDMTRLPSPVRATLGLVRTFQVPREYTHLTVRENLMAAAPAQAGENLADVFFRWVTVRQQEEEIGARVNAHLDMLNLRRVEHVKAGQLSGGQKKLVELGRALMSGARTIMLDEPFAGVNPVLIEEISLTLRQLHQQGIGFLIIEHELKALTRLVDTLHVMDRGRLIASGTPRDVLGLRAVQEAYLGGSTEATS